MEDRIHYTDEQFYAATKELKEILATIPTLRRHPRTGDIWELVSIIGFEGTELKANARTKSTAISVRLQDDGSEPYAVVDITKWNGREKRKNWHAASTSICIGRLYPFQFCKIPQLVEWLESIEVPSPKDILD